MNKDQSATLRRRNFLKAAGGAALALAATKEIHGQSATSKSYVERNHERQAPPDRGLWITWYDLPADGRDAHFSWLHGMYLPGLLKRPGYLWAAHYVPARTSKAARKIPSGTGMSTIPGSARDITTCSSSPRRTQACLATLSRV